MLGRWKYSNIISETYLLRRKQKFSEVSLWLLLTAL
jgi:hypothetical protein